MLRLPNTMLIWWFTNVPRNTTPPTIKGCGFLPQVNTTPKRKSIFAIASMTPI